MSTTMALRNKAGVFVGAALLRLVLFTAFPRLPDLLTGRVEISTPVTSFKRCALLPRPNTTPRCRRRIRAAIDFDGLTW